MSQSEFWGCFSDIANNPGLNVKEVDLYSEELIGAYDYLYPIDDDALYNELVNIYGGPVLELGCGTGRVLIRMAKKGVEITGLDNSQPALDVAKNRVDLLGDEISRNVTLLNEDATDFNLGKSFQLIVLPASTVVVFTDPQARESIFKMAALHLHNDSSRFVFDFPIFDWETNEQWDSKVFEVDVPMNGSNAKVRLGVKATPDKCFLNANTHWELQEESGLSQHILERNIRTVIDLDLIEEELTSAGLTVFERRTEGLPGDFGQRRILICGLQSSHEYPLWQPHMPNTGLKENHTILVKGEGLNVEDDAGKQYIDLSAGIWSTQCGLGHPHIIDAITQQLKRLSYATLFAGLANEPALELSRKLVELSPVPLPWVYLTGSGSESVELSIKIARRFHLARGEPERHNIAYLSHSYHGTFFGSMGVSGLHTGREESGPGLAGMIPVPAPIPSFYPEGSDHVVYDLECAAAFERIVAASEGSIAAFIIEPVLGSAGAVVPSREYFSAIQTTCRKFGVLLIVDEIATGFGRTGDWFASVQLGIKPDILLLSKGISSGYLPLGAVLFSNEIGHALRERNLSLGHGSSHNGNPACCAAGLATIEVLENEDLITKAAQLGSLFHSRLEALVKIPLVKRINGLGLMLGIELIDEEGNQANPLQVSTLYALLKESGVLAYPVMSSLVFLPALTITESQIDTCLTKLEAILKLIRFVDGNVEYDG